MKCKQHLLIVSRSHLSDIVQLSLHDYIPLIKIVIKLRRLNWSLDQNRDY